MKRGHRTISTPGRESGTKFKENSEKEDMKNRVLTIIEQTPDGPKTHKFVGEVSIL